LRIKPYGKKEYNHNSFNDLIVSTLKSQVGGPAVPETSGSRIGGGGPSGPYPSRYKFDIFSSSSNLIISTNKHRKCGFVWHKMFQHMVCCIPSNIHIQTKFMRKNPVCNAKGFEGGNAMDRTIKSGNSSIKI
jgi:hypothetical protein